ncbi:unnamed protein product [Cuscuta campestris]|uniref:CCHC-type domain-containing protein n=1 Tax=Cuscuta campestris TaxID=132261 RepID=A0A484N7D9_9ASTE|nr:unnamed protein product [Cuscuta campestris]
MSEASNNQNETQNMEQNVEAQPDPIMPVFLTQFLQQMANAPMFQPPPPRKITLKTLKDNGAEEFHGDRISDPQIALDWIEQTERVLKNLSVPDARRPELAFQLLHFSKAYYLMAKAEKDVDDYKASLKAEEGGPSTRPTVSVTPSAKRPLSETSEASHAKKSKSVQVQPAPTQSVASSGRSKPSRHPTCELCGRNHPGECWFAQGHCLGCGKSGHIRRTCSTKPGEPFPTAPMRGQTATPQLTQSQCTTAGTNKQRNPNQPQGRAPARTYAMIGHADPQDNDVHNGNLNDE